MTADGRNMGPDLRQEKHPTWRVYKSR